MLENKIEKFLDRLADLQCEFDLSLGHEDEHGSFVIHSGMDTAYIEWQQGATRKGFVEGES